MIKGYEAPVGLLWIASPRHRMTSSAAQTNHGGLSKKHAEREQLLAAAIGNLTGLELSLKFANDEIKADKYGFTATHLAALHGRLQCLKLLVQGYNADVNLASVAGWRPIHLVLSKKSGPRALECMEYLIEQGADINAYLRHAMWMRDKEELDEEIQKLEKLKINLMGDDNYVKKKYKKEQDLFCQLAFCDWLENKQFDEKRKKAFLHQSEETSDVDSQTYRRRRGEIEKLLYREERYQKALMEALVKAQKEEPRSESKPSSKCKTQTHPVLPDKKAAEKVTIEEVVKERSPSGAVHRTGNASTKGVKHQIKLEDLQNFDFGSYLSFAKDMFDHSNINVHSGGTMVSPSKLTKEDMRKYIVPGTVVNRIQMPQELKARHIFDVKRKRKSAKAHESEVGLHLGETLDPSLLSRHKPTASPNASFCSS
ncbi:ankyrin repeat domain-containing protein 53 isoform X3 [Ambystoma mexicanum]|uniref:ankyrin repeat domain-containing protein 53 isoform X3 n=1 Tax=Ambystoma mexicanum TaxID=8296 RepID=UPI0037E90C74